MDFAAGVDNSHFAGLDFPGHIRTGLQLPFSVGETNSNNQRVLAKAQSLNDADPIALYLGGVNQRTIDLYFREDGSDGETLHDIETVGWVLFGDTTLLYGTPFEREFSSSDTLKPTPPTNLTLIEEAQDSVLIEWNVSMDNDGVDSYRIFILDKANNFRVMDVPAPTETGTITHWVDNLELNQEYTFWITAIDGFDNQSDPSDKLYYNTTDLIFEQGQLYDVSGEWRTVTLDHTFTNMVVVATPVLNNASSQTILSRIRNASGNSFDIRLESPSGTVTDYSNVHYIVMEEGLYTEARNGIKCEAVLTTSSVVSSRSNWRFEPRSFTNNYTSPVVVGQVMTTNDTDWSVFWASANDNRKAIPTNNSFAAGKHVGEDNETIRSDETIGFIVFESGSGELIPGVFYDAWIISEVRGLDNDFDTSFDFESINNPETAVLSSARMNGNDGGFPVLLGQNPLTNNSISIVIAEDQLHHERTPIRKKVIISSTERL